MNLNKVTLIGRLGQDPKSTITQSGTQIVTFSVATTLKSKGEDKTEWHNITCFGTLATNVMAYCTKGMLVYVEGRLQYDKYIDKQGVEVTKAKIIANNVTFLERGEKKETSDPFSNDSKHSTPLDQDSIPF